MPKLNFNTQVTRRQPIRTAPAKFLSSALRGHVERSDGIRPADAFYPYRCLPVMFIDTELSDGVVIPKGNIVSLVTNQTATGTTASGIVEISSSGTIPVFQDATAGTTPIVSANIDDSFWGYPDSVAALLVPANGGVTSRIPYSTDDVTVGTFTCSGLAVTTAMVADPANNYCAVEANMPVGIVYGDVYQDIRGKYLNYNVWDVWGILCDYYIEVPYVDFGTGGLTTFVSGYVDRATTYITDLSSATCAGYIAAWKKYQFLYFDSNNGAKQDGKAGQLLVPDLYGKFKPYTTFSSSTGSDVSTASITAPFTTQTIGKLLLTDSRFPKDMLEVVDTYQGSGMPGTETGGLPSILYNFVRDVLYGINGTYPTIQTVVNNVQGGCFGIARIQLNI